MRVQLQLHGRRRGRRPHLCRPPPDRRLRSRHLHHAYVEQYHINALLDDDQHDQYDDDGSADVPSGRPEHRMRRLSRRCYLHELLYRCGRALHGNVRHRGHPEQLRELARQLDVCEHSQHRRLRR